MGTFRIRGLGEVPNVVPAPMAGYGDRAWRDIARRMGCSLVVVPMISAEGVVHGDAKTHALVDIDGESPPVAVQLFGTRPEALAEAALWVESRAAAAIDLNLGCPARRVVRHGGGAAILQFPDLVADLVRAIRRAVNITLTVKMRAGWDQGGARTAELARIVESEGADAIVLHARTGRQGFTGAANWSWIADAKQAVSIPVVGNGDVRTGEDAWRMQRQTGCDAIMIGRAATGNLWLFREALAWLEAGGPPAEPVGSPSDRERLDTLLEHASLMARYRGAPRGVIEFRKHAVCYVKGMRGAKALKQRLVACESVADVERALEIHRRESTSLPATK